MAHEHANEIDFDNRAVHHEVCAEDVTIMVAVTESISFCRDWVRKTKFCHAKHDELQVGVAIRTNQAGDYVVLALSVGNHCLVIRLPEVLEGCLADFLTDDNNRFVGFHQEPPVELANYKTMAQLGDNHQLFPVVAWNNWPLTDDQVMQVAVESRDCFLVALRNHRL